MNARQVMKQVNQAVAQAEKKMFEDAMENGGTIDERQFDAYKDLQKLQAELLDTLNELTDRIRIIQSI